MKILKLFLGGLVLTMTACGTSTNSYAQGLSDILGNVTNSNSTGNILSGIIEGVFTKSNLSLSDLVGEYQAQGAAVTFKSENLLQKAGGIAAASAIETKVNPYYDQYGLNSMTLTIDENANFVMKIKAISLKGTITKNESEGTFNFNFNVAGISLGKFTAYIEKSGKNLNLMFDATKLKSFISTIAKFTGNSMASTLGSLLDSYDGLCIGWKMVCTSSSQSNGDSSVGNSITNGLNSLKGILKGN